MSENNETIETAAEQTAEQVKAAGEVVGEAIKDGTVKPDLDAPLGEGGLKALQAERQRADAAEKAAKEAAARIKEYEDRDKSEEQKRAEELETLRAELAAANAAKAESDLNSMRRDVALAKGIPVALVDRLRGDDRPALEADADSLLELIKTDDAAHRKPRPDPTLGQPNAGVTSSKNEQFNRAIQEAFENTV